MTIRHADGFVLVTAAPCGEGDLYGGNEPARTWFTAMKPIATSFGDVKMPPTDPRYVDGSPASRVPAVTGLDVDAARQRIKEAGFQVDDQTNPVNSSAKIRRGGRNPPPARRFRGRSSQSRSATASRPPRRRRVPGRWTWWWAAAAGRIAGHRNSGPAADHHSTAGATAAPATGASVGARRDPSIRHQQ